MRNPHNLRVYEKAVKLYKAIAGYRPPYRSPLFEAQRSTESIHNNIREGCRRPTEPDFLRFLGYAQGSAEEASGQFWQCGINGQLPRELADRLEDAAQHILAMLINLRRANLRRLGKRP